MQLYEMPHTLKTESISVSGQTFGMLQVIQTGFDILKYLQIKKATVS